MSLSSQIRLWADQQGMVLMRNNSGVLPDKRKVPVRFGLGNESEKLNMIRKSSDWIGWTHDGYFVAIEEKPADWRFMGDAHELAQERFLGMVNRAGGFGVFCSAIWTLKDNYQAWRRRHAR